MSFMRTCFLLTHLWPVQWLLPWSRWLSHPVLLTASSGLCCFYDTSMNFSVVLFVPTYSLFPYFPKFSHRRSIRLCPVTLFIHQVCPGRSLLPFTTPTWLFVWQPDPSAAFWTSCWFSDFTCCCYLVFGLPVCLCSITWTFLSALVFSPP